MNENSQYLSEKHPLISKVKDDYDKESQFPTHESITDSKTNDSEKSRQTKRGLWMLILVIMLLSVAGNFYKPVVNNYIYQVFSEEVYGNSSGYIQVAKQPCVEVTTGNVSSDKLREQVQDKSADLHMHLSVISGVIAIIVNLILGSYADVMGRRFALLLPITGHFLRTVAVPVIIYWNLGVNALYAGNILDGLCGGGPGLLLGCYVYTADLTRADHQRTLGMAMVAAASSLGTATSQIAAGLFVQEAGFLYPSLLASGLMFTSMMVVFLWLPETLTNKNRKFEPPWECIKRMLGAVVLNENAYKRYLLWLCLLSFFVGVTAENGAGKAQELFLMNKPFCWDSFHSSILGTIKDVSTKAASLTLIKFLESHVSTPVMAILGALSDCGRWVLLGFAFNDLMVYLVAVMGLARGILWPSVRSLMSNMVSRERQGALFGSIAVMEGVCESIGQTIILSIYEMVVGFFPGLIFFIVAGCCAVIVFIYVVYIIVLKQSKISLLPQNFEAEVPPPTDSENNYLTKADAQATAEL